MVVGRFARPRRRLRAGLLQLLCVVAGLGLGLLLPRITTETSVASSRVTESLVAVGFGILGLVSGRIVAAIIGPSEESGPRTRIRDGPNAA